MDVSCQELRPDIRIGIFVLAFVHALGRPGSDLLSHVLRRSTIGAEGFHGRVRNGIGCRPLAITTRSSKRAATRLCECGSCRRPAQELVPARDVSASDQAKRAISTG